MEIEERIKTALKNKDMNYQEVSEKTGIPKARWDKALNGHLKLRWEEIDAVCNLFPEYEYWITRGKTAPEIGQVSPEIESTAESYKTAGGD